MITVHVENTVRDFDAWKANFDKFDRFRVDQGVRSYRVARRTDEPNRFYVDLTFDDVATATAFRSALGKIMATPQAQELLLSHSAPVMYEVADERDLTATAASTS
ncbi:MAG: hypothetical protein ACJ72D_18350 [Marmoricola sp.]